MRYLRQHIVFRTTLVLATAVLIAPACTLEDGQPWGQVDFEVRNLAMDTSGRMEGQLVKTANDYGLEIEALTVEFSTISAVQTSVDAAGFDPANPPEGYSLCHNGHCHAADGQLVAYEDIQAELSGASTTGGAVSQEIDSNADALTDQTLLMSTECSDDCQLDRGQIGLINLGVTSLTLKARVVDLSTQDRLPEDGIEFEHTWESAITLSNVVSVEVGDPPPGIGLKTSFQLSPKVLDGIDWLAPEDSVDAVVFGVSESAVQTEVSRYEL